MNIFGQKHRKEAGVKSTQILFCKNCGHKITSGIRFCPECGTESTMVKNFSGDTARSSHDDSMEKKKRHGKHFKIYYAGIAGISVLAVICVTVLVKFHNNADSAQDQGYKFNKEFYKNSSFSNKQIKELEKEYDAAYDDEMKALDSYILAYMESYDEYGEVKKEFENLIGVTEEFYQAVNAYDPELKGVLAKDAAGRYGNSPLSSHLVEQGVGIVLSDSELGKNLRGILEITGLGLLEMLTIKSMEDEDKTRKDAMLPIAFGGDYFVARSYGTIGQMLEQIEKNSGYIVANEAISKREEAIENDVDLSGNQNENTEKVFNAYKKSENYKGRSDALRQKKKEWSDNLYKWESDFLVQIGIENADDILKAGNENDEGNPADERYTYIDEDKEKALSPYVYSIMDNEGKVYSSFLVANAELGAAINQDGLCSIWNGTLDDNCTTHVILDKKGKILFRNDEKEAKDGSRSVYYNVTPSGNILKKTFTSDYEHGDYQILECIKPDGNSEKLLEGGYINLSEAIPGKDDYLILSNPNDNCSDYYKYECGYEDGKGSYDSGFIDMKSGKLITTDAYEEIVREERENRIGGMNDIEQLDANLDDKPKTTRLNEQYVLYDDEDTIYDNSGKAVKTLEDGRGVKDILYTGDQYWIITNSGWYYILDDNFNEILKPVEIPENAKYNLTKYGLLVAGNFTDESGKEQEAVCLYDNSGNSEMLSDTHSDLEIKDYMVYGGENGWINLNTKKTVLISTPEKPISLKLE